MENKIWNAVEGFDPNDSLICYRKTEKNADGTARLNGYALYAAPRYARMVFALPS